MSEMDEFNKQLMDELAKLTVPQVKKPEFRLYYDADGKVITYTVEDLPGNFLVITAEQFAEARSDVLVKFGKIIYTHKQTHVFKLEKSAIGKKCSKYDVSVIDDSDDAVCWEQVIYEIR